ncbi:AAA family ATPase [Xenorhabdus bovienii]|uniref:Endonuclease GajA/Old nuclease/RecF-like AAA domain-containing protein n=4 Tax=Xenorhabdus bovienii TaxID=40576 RepID=A0A077PJB4_XENBV|nr:retron Ec78 anti-phage system effector ATPase PtuA [Xenorhabdus bovienii]MDE1473045.1 AAA family ATPase [Xenorhabdus bovienii]MDE1479994.1 AAA family ATPase [Xenorhabdus bovienii]MDE1494563.1 AAA family ATPase [Xenorhabdus bovienii]MDE9474849.1 AAA family ATPase [Xenorhabdus bovienii]MDE9511701.1 AAA family ATPase [Xenorhabdus bovienii]
MKKNRHIRALEMNAKKGDLLANFNLYQEYFSGEMNVEKNESLSEHYFEQCCVLIEENNFILESLKLIDFRRFKKLNIEKGLDRHLTVFIGTNGEGKTSIIEAISKTLSWLNANILKEDGQGSGITYDDIHNESEGYADIYTEFKYGVDTRINARLSRAIEAASKKRDSEVVGLKSIANMWRIINDKRRINLPLFASYLIERSYPFKINKRNFLIDMPEKRRLRFDAYTDALRGTGKFENFVDWFISLSKIKKYGTSIFNEELNQLKKQIEIKVMNEILSTIYDDSILKEMKNRYLESLEEKQDDGSYESIIVSKVIEAISHVVPSVEDIWVTDKSGVDEILVLIDGKAVKLTQLSDGQRVFIALVADLTRRLVLLNPEKENPLEGNGIVLIDEIELHLHPKWQQSIITTLQETFPNIQFIISTHSPQVLSTVNRKNIRYFSGEDDTGAVWLRVPDFQTKGVANSDVLEQLMNTFSIPDLPESKWVNDLIELVEKDNYENNSNAKELFNKIKEHFGDEHPEVKRCESHIRLQSLKVKARKKFDKKKGEN